MLNFQSRALLNCAGGGTCGTCMVEVNYTSNYQCLITTLIHINSEEITKSNYVLHFDCFSNIDHLVDVKIKNF